MYFGFTKKKVACSVAILVTCLVGDKNSIPIKDGDLAAAVCDNLTHAIIGLFVWASVVLGKSSMGSAHYLQILACGLISSIIDLDHFIAARSLSLKDATNLAYRPIFHCTSGAIIVSGITLMVAYMLQISWLYKLGWILLAALLSHHIRDSTRRGFWMWPFGTTKPLPYIAYLLAEILLPNAIIMLMSAYSGESIRSHDRSHATIV